MAQAPANPFANAVRSVARSAGAVAMGTVKAGAACAAAAMLLAAAHGYAHNGYIPEQAGIPGAAQVAAMAAQNVSAARVQAKMSEYYACGLLRVTKAELDGFSAGARVDRIRAMAAETLGGAEAQARPSTSMAQAISNVADMAGAVSMAGLSRVVDAAIGSAASHEWAARMQANLDGLPAKLAERSRAAGIARDAQALEAAAEDIEASYQGMGCRI